ncbi:hypothetical protein ONZ51_g799 [Trametes cubensis]|uniref:Uncharacterized protein n=1 Tax=Trametes cubensis TaxID=1111947 RepID=A0AAD7XFF7_9APHY|nr:hypothetical protein ONZ51_g799 [Trametes cubensis]
MDLRHLRATYQRLRQICNNDYQVQNFGHDPPGDHCDDQVVVCCCNTVAFQLSMLCMNCQHDLEAGDVVGIDAGVGTYAAYRASCGAGTSNALPADIQQAVCNENIRLDDYLYGGWSDGSWFYVWTRENAERDHAANDNNTFTHCPNQESPSSSTTKTLHADPSSILSSTRLSSELAMASATVALSSVPSSSAAPSSYGPAIGESLTSSTTQPNTESTGAVTSIDLSPASRSSFGKSAAIGGAISAACILALVVAAVVLRRTKIRKRTIKKPIANDTVHMASIIVPYAIIGDDQPG